MNIAIITGASSGIGEAFLREIIKERSAYGSVPFDEIWVIARRGNVLESLQNQIKTKIRPISLDLTQSESFDSYKNLLEQEKPEVMLLVNAAGYGRFADFDDFPVEDDLKMIDLNVKALHILTKLFLKDMVVT